MTKSNDGESFAYLPERLQRFSDKHYEEQRLQQDNSPFTMVSIHSIREDHEAILTQANKVLSEYANSDKLITVAKILLLNHVGTTHQDDIVEAFGDDIAALVADTVTSFDQDSGNAVFWEESLLQMEQASADAQRIRLALLQGQIMYSPGATGHLPFWHQEAKALSHGDPVLQQQVIARIEADWPASG